MQWECMGLTPLEHVNMIKEASPNTQNSILLFFLYTKNYTEIHNMFNKNKKVNL